MLNVVCLMGRLVADPALRQTTTGRSVASFRIAVDRNNKRDADSSRPADFFDVVAWEHTADFVARHFAKGDLVAVEGRLQSRTWQDDSGSKRQVVEVVAGSVHFTGERARRDHAETAPAAPAYTGAAMDADGFVDLGGGGDIPF